MSHLAGLRLQGGGGRAAAAPRDTKRKNAQRSDLVLEQLIYE